MMGLAGAAVALALAVLVLPTSPRHRLAVAPEGRRHRRLPRLPCAAGAACAAVVLMPVPTVLAAVIAAATLLGRRRERSRRRRIAAEAAALDTALDVVAGELRAGAHPVAAFDTAASESEGPVAAALASVAARARLGADVPAGLRSAAAGSSVPAQWERLAVCWELAQTHGLAMATLVRAAQRDIVERTRFADRVNAGMAGARATASVLAGLPVVGVALGQLLGADPLRLLLSGGAGGWLLVVGVTLGCLGLLWSDRITGRVLT